MKEFIESIKKEETKHYNNLKDFLKGKGKYEDKL